MLRRRHSERITMLDEEERSGLQTAAGVAHTAAAAARIAKAAAASGAPGAAAEAAKEALPFLVKLIVGLIIGALIVPMLVFTAMPNMFFGYEHTAVEQISSMREKALAVGGTYYSLEDFEKNQIDAIVTSMAAEYERQGTVISKIVVNNELEEDDLLWLIAINSVAYQQDLDVMTPETIRELCVSRLNFSPSLSIFTAEDGGTTATLTVTIKKLDPEAFMEKLEFDEDESTWAGALQETLEESDALNQYAEYFEAYKPSYSGDTSYSGSVEHGSGYGNSVDSSGFSNPGTKNAYDLAVYALQAYENNWGYVWGTYGTVLSESMLDYKLEQYPDGVGNFEDFIRESWLGRRTTDCVGLIKGYGWLDPATQEIEYGTNGMPDYSANDMYRISTANGAETGSMDTLPDIPGIVLWKEGHTGVYVGNGYAVEAMGTQYGVVRTAVDGRGWQAWYKLPYITYD